MTAILVALRRCLGLEFTGDPFDGDHRPPMQAIPAQNGAVVQLSWPRHRQKPKKRSAKAKASRAISLVVLSDTHLGHADIAVPPADVLLHAGDFGKWNASLDAVVQFNAWLGSLPHPVKVVIAGNHDKFAAATLRATLTNATFLHNQSALILVHGDNSVSLALPGDVDAADDADVVARLKLHGHPQTQGRSFVYRANAHSTSLDERHRLCAAIDDDVDILLSHAPPFGILDLSSKHEGCAALRRRVEEINPMLHVFGHCHGHGGRCVRADDGAAPTTTFINAAQEIATPVQVRIQINA